MNVDNEVYETKAYAKKSLEICLERDSHDFSLIGNKISRTSESAARLRRKISYCKNSIKLANFKHALKIRERRLILLDKDFTNLRVKIRDINRALKTAMD